MSDINVVVLSCVIDGDPEVCTFPTGSKVFQCRVIGPGLPYRDRQSDTWRRHPLFIDLKAWNRGNGRLADLCEKRLVRGSKIIVQGTIITDEWTSEDGKKQSRILIDVKDIEFLDG